MMVPSSEDIYFEKTRFTISPQEILIKDDGTADLWLRTFAGELTDEFSIELYLDNGDDGEVIMRRKVDLVAENKTIEFNEGGMTIFSVGGSCIATAVAPPVKPPISPPATLVSKSHISGWSRLIEAI